MTKKTTHPESEYKAARSAGSGMERFKELARQIVNVSNKKVLEERQRSPPKRKSKRDRGAGE